MHYFVIYSGGLTITFFKIKMAFCDESLNLQTLLSAYSHAGRSYKLAD